MNKEIREIINTAKEVIDVSERADKLGFSSSNIGGIQVFDDDVFKKLVVGSKQEPELQVRDDEYKYWYKIKVDGIKFFRITKEPLFFEGIDLTEVK